MKFDMPQSLEYMTADEAAECVPYHDPTGALYTVLWGFLADAKNPTPHGGDGSNGTVETPEVMFALCSMMRSMIVSDSGGNFHDFQ